MSETQIEANTIYDHEKYGEVLVTGIAQMYKTWDVSKGCGHEGEMFVYFHKRFDDYGGIATPETERIRDFYKASSKKRAFEYEIASKLQEEESIDNIRDDMKKRDYESLDPEDFTTE